MNICFNEYLQKISPSTWSLNLSPDAFTLIESYLNTILLNIKSFQPHTPQDLEKIITSFSASLSLPVIQDSHLNVEKNQNRQYYLMFDRITLVLQKEYFPYRLNYNVSIILASFLEYICLRIFKRLEMYANIRGKKEIDKCDLNFVIHAFKESSMILSHKINENGDQNSESIWPHYFYYLNHQANNYGLSPLETKRFNSKSYADLVKLFINEETLYIKNLKLLLKLFKKNFQSTYSQEMDEIFANLDDVYYLSVRLLWMLEDIESGEERGETVGIGYLIEDLTMCAEFDVYDLYAEQIVNPNHYDHILAFLAKAKLANNASCPYSSDSVWRYVLPHLLLGPIIRCFDYFDLIQELGEVSQSLEDKESLATASLSLEPLKAKLNSLCPVWFPRRVTPLNSMYGKQWDSMKGPVPAPTCSKVQEVKKCIEGWEDVEKDASTQLLMEGNLGKLSSASSLPKKMGASERYAFAFDGALVLCKMRAGPVGPLTPTAAPTTLRRTSSHAIGGRGPSRDSDRQPIESLPDFRIKEWFRYRSLRVEPRDDIPEYKFAFDLSNLESTAIASSPPSLISSGQAENINSITLYTKTEGERQSWLSLLLKLSLDDVFEKNLNEVLEMESKSDPFTLLPYLKDTYRFAQPDTPSNLILEERVGGQSIVKGGTFDKLVERLTHHNMDDTTQLTNFLVVYRSFATPATLFKALVDRFNIPNIDEDIENAIVKDAILNKNGAQLISLGDEATNEKPLIVDQESVDINVKEKILRFRRDYVQLVQNRVLNVFRHWILAHFYDFERDPDLMEQLLQFVNSLKGKWKKNWRDIFNRNIQNKLTRRDRPKQIIFSVPPPPIEWHLAKAKDQFTILTLHPVELARQLTLYEFELYSAIKPSELVGSVWTKTDKHYTSPNLLKMTQHSTKVTYWLERCIVYTENLEERVAVMTRIIEILSVLNELNNFNGVLEFLGALSSAPVYRLEHTFKELPNKATKVLEQAMTLISDRHFVRYKEKLNSINPPCVPFLGVYMSDILHIEEGNPDRFPTNPKLPDEESRDGDKLINFYKWIKVAEVCKEINVYQNMPYCLAVEMDIRTFILDLDPFNGAAEKDIDDILYEKSLEIEPKNCKQAPKFERRLEPNFLKSPGTKVTPVLTHTSATLPNIKPVASKPQPLSIGHSLSNLSLNSSTPLPLTPVEGAFKHSIPPPTSPDTPTSPGVTSVCSRTALIQSKTSSTRRGSLSSSKIKTLNSVPSNAIARHARFFQRFQSLTTPAPTNNNNDINNNTNPQSLPCTAISPGPSPTDSTAPLLSCQTSPFYPFSDVTIVLGQSCKTHQVNNSNDSNSVSASSELSKNVFNFCQSPSSFENGPPPLPPKTLFKNMGRGALPPPLPLRKNVNQPPPLPPKSFKTKLRRENPM